MHIMKTHIFLYQKGGKTCSHSEGGDTSFVVVLQSELEVSAILKGGGGGGGGPLVKRGGGHSKRFYSVCGGGGGGSTNRLR